MHLVLEKFICFLNLGIFSYGALVAIFVIYAKSYAERWSRELRGPSGRSFGEGAVIAPVTPPTPIPKTVVITKQKTLTCG